MKTINPTSKYTFIGLGYFALHLSSIYVHQAWIYLAYEMLFIAYLFLGMGKKKFLFQAGILHVLLTVFYIPELFYTRGLSLSNPLAALVFYPAAHFLLLIIVAGISNKRKKHLRKLS